MPHVSTPVSKFMFVILTAAVTVTLAMTMSRHLNLTDT